MRKLPKGNFFCSKNGKKYLSLCLEDLKREKTAIEFYLRHHSKQERKSELLLKKCPEYNVLLSATFQPLSLELEQWQNAHYESNPLFPETLIHSSASGHMLRSKSESMIDTHLYLNKIPFHYEELLQLKQTAFYPDFTIRHPRTGRVIYWEHFGMMDEPEYAAKAVSKLSIYVANGIIPSINLITTFETKAHPLTYETINKLIEHYFL